MFFIFCLDYIQFPFLKKTLKNKETNEVAFFSKSDSKKLFPHCAWYGKGVFEPQTRSQAGIIVGKMA